MRNQRGLIQFWVSAAFLSSLCGPGAGTVCKAQFGPQAALEPIHWSWRVTYLANEGVLFGRDDNSVLVDALFREGVKGYDRLDDFRQNYLETGGKPFDKVPLVLVTHKHADHFDAYAVTRFLKENDKAIFASSPQVVELLSAVVGDDPGIESRIKTVDPRGDGKVELSVGELKVDAVRLSHGEDKMSDVTNLGFIVYMGEKRVLHVGDAQLNDITRKPLLRHAVGVDAACVPYWWALDEDGRRFLHDTLKVGRIIAIHIPPDRRDEILSRIREADKSITVLLKYPQSTSFSRVSKK